MWNYDFYVIEFYCKYIKMNISRIEEGSKSWKMTLQIYFYWIVLSLDLSEKQIKFVQKIAIHVFQDIVLFCKFLQFCATRLTIGFYENNVYGLMKIPNKAEINVFYLVGGGYPYPFKFFHKKRIHLFCTFLKCFENFFRINKCQKLNFALLKIAFLHCFRSKIIKKIKFTLLKIVELWLLCHWKKKVKKLQVFRSK